MFYSWLEVSFCSAAKSPSLRFIFLSALSFAPRLTFPPRADGWLLDRSRWSCRLVRAIPSDLLLPELTFCLCPQQQDSRRPFFRASLREVGADQSLPTPQDVMAGYIASFKASIGL